MKYVILIHSNPDPWGHPTQKLTTEGRALPAEQISASGELVSAEALGDPASSTVFGWTAGGHVATDGPYAETKEQLAGFFIIDCATRQRAEEIATKFAQPGGVIELRPVMWPGGDDA